MRDVEISGCTRDVGFLLCGGVLAAARLESPVFDRGGCGVRGLVCCMCWTSVTITTGPQLDIFRNSNHMSLPIL